MDTNARGKNVQPKPNCTVSLKGKRILAVEDNADIRFLLKLMLLAAEGTVEFAETGEMAITRGTQTPFDVILMDNHLPDMTGTDVAKELRKRGCAIPIIAVSADCEPDGESSLFFNSFLQKPVSATSLVAAISKLT